MAALDMKGTVWKKDIGAFEGHLGFGGGRLVRDEVESPSLHLGVDRSGVVIAQALTEANVDDAPTGMIPAVDDDLASVTGEAACDTVAVYGAVVARVATVVVPPIKDGHRYLDGDRDRAHATARYTDSIPTIVSSSARDMSSVP